MIKRLEALERLIADKRSKIDIKVWKYKGKVGFLVGHLEEDRKAFETCKDLPGFEWRWFEDIEGLREMVCNETQD